MFVLSCISFSLPVFFCSHLPFPVPNSCLSVSLIPFSLAFIYCTFISLNFFLPTFFYFKFPLYRFFLSFLFLLLIAFYFFILISLLLPLLTNFLISSVCFLSFTLLGCYLIPLHSFPSVSSISTHLVYCIFLSYLTFYHPLALPFFNNTLKLPFPCILFFVIVILWLFCWCDMCMLCTHCHCLPDALISCTQTVSQSDADVCEKTS